MDIKVLRNILYSSVDQLLTIISQFISGILIIRFLPREDYGLLGVIAGYFVFFNVINISIESILLRDHNKYDNVLDKIAYLTFFNYIKILIILILSFILGLFLINFAGNENVFYAIGITYVVMASQAIISPLSIFYSSKFNQKLVTKLNISKSIFRLILLSLLVYSNSIKVYFAIELIVAFFLVCSWKFIFLYIHKINLFNRSSYRNVDLKFIKKSLLDYSLWTHLNGVVTQVIYKSDTFFLSFFENNIVVGNYNVALNSANMANILPSILGYHNSIALSNLKDNNEIKKVTNQFIKISFYVSFIIFVVFLIFGGIYINILTGDKDISEIYHYQLFIVAGLLISKSLTSPLVSYINIFDDVKRFFKHVSVPILFTTLSLYFISVKIYGPLGIAAANILNSIIWLVLILNYVKKIGFQIEFKLNLIKDLENLKRII